MSTYSDSDGAIPGKLKVAVLAVREVPSPKGGEPTIEYLIPARYGSPGGSGVVVDLPPTGDSHLQIDLK
jgi:hypothetical protein